MIIDKDFTIRFINTAGAAVIGRSKSELIGTKCYDSFKDIRLRHRQVRLCCGHGPWAERYQSD